MNEPHGSRLDAAIESQLAKFLARIVVPLLVTALCFFMRGALVQLQSNQVEQGRDIVQIKSDVRDINTRLDAQVLRQVETNTKNIERLDDRVQKLERRFGE